MEVGSDVSITEVLLNAHDMMAAQIKDGKTNIDYNLIEAVLKKNKPRCEADIAGGLHWLQKYGGGVHGKYIHELKEFVQVCTVPGCTISGDVFDAVAGWMKTLTESQSVPEMAVAVIKSAAQSQVPMSVALIKGMATPQKVKDLMLGNHVLRRCRELADGAGLTNKDWTVAIGKVDVAMSLFLRKLATKKQFKQVPDLGWWFCTEVMNPPLASEWPPMATEPATATSAPTMNTKPTYINYNEKGQVEESMTTVLKIKDISVGCRVIARGAKQPWQITAIQEDSKAVQMAMVATDGSVASKRVSVPFDDFAKQYQLTKNEYAHMEWPAKDFMYNPENKLTFAINACGMALHVLREALPPPKLTVTSKPQKLVVANDKYTKGSLKLVLTSARVILQKLAMTKSQASTSVMVQGDIPKSHLMYICQSPVGKDGWFCPAWIIYGNTTSKEDEGNMELKFQAVTVPYPYVTIGKKECKSDVADMEFKLPYLTNCKAIKSGDVLKLYQPEAPKQQSQGMKRTLADMAKPLAEQAAAKKPAK
jgi:hypothetical protein